MGEVGPSVGLIGEVCECLLHTGMLLGQRREQLIANPHTCVVGIGIRRISDHIADAKMCEVGLNLCA